MYPNGRHSNCQKKTSYFVKFSPIFEWFSRHWNIRGQGPIYQLNDGLLKFKLAHYTFAKIGIYSSILFCQNPWLYFLLYHGNKKSRRKVEWTDGVLDATYWAVDYFLGIFLFWQKCNLLCIIILAKAYFAISSYFCKSVICNILLFWQKCNLLCISIQKCN